MAIEYQRRQFTIDEFQRLYEFEILRREDRVELIDGELIVMSPVGPDHDWVVMRLGRLLFARFPEPLAVGIQGSLRLETRSMPLPDGLVIRPEAVRTGRPVTLGDVLLVVEVASTSLRYDRLKKGPLYARFGIPEYWIVDVAAQAVEVYREPAGERFASFVRAHRGERLPSVALPGESPQVDVLFDQPG